MHRIVLLGHQVRSISFAYSFLVVGLHLWERHADPLWIAPLALQFVLYPQLAWLHARRAADPRRAELGWQYADAVLLGAWSAALGLPTWITYAACFSPALNGAVSRGATGVGCALALFCLGLLAWIVPFGLEYWPATSPLVTALCFAGSLGYTCAVGALAHRLNRDLAALRQVERRAQPRGPGT